MTLRLGPGLVLPLDFATEGVAVIGMRGSGKSNTTQRLAPAIPSDGPVKLKAGARRMLETLARQHPMQLTRRQLGTLARVKSSGGTFGDYLSTLRTSGFIYEEHGYVFISDEGFAAISSAPSAPLTTDEIVTMYRSKLKAGARRMLDALVEVWPNGLTREELAGLADITLSGGTFGDYLSTLRTNGLAEERDHVVYAGEALQLS